MSADLPALGRDEFVQRLLELSPRPVSSRGAAALFAHYETLRKWARRQSLIGPGSATEAIERHYGESLAALALIDEREAGELVDVGSGAGFPGIVLAAACPGLRVTLLEPRQKKWAFLEAAVRAAALPCTCLDARVEDPLAGSGEGSFEGLPGRIPAPIHLVTVRALDLSPGQISLLAGRLGPAGRFLFWRGVENPSLPPGLVAGREVALVGSERRRILEVRQQVDPG